MSLRVTFVLLAIVACKRDDAAQSPAVSGSGSGSSTSTPEPTPTPTSSTPVPVPVTPIDATSGASPQMGSGSAVVTNDKPVDGAALRTRHRERIAADTSAVTVLTGGTALELGQRACESIVPQRSAETPVLIKPNMSGFNWFKDPKKHGGDNGVTGRITDPEFVRGVIRCLKARGHTRITIADGFTGKPTDWARLTKVSGYGAMAKEEGVALVALDDDGVFDVEGEQPGKPLAISGIAKSHVPTLLMPKVLAEHLDHGLYISIPKLKAHRYAVFSLGIKAMQGTVMYSDATPAYQQKWRSHREISNALALVKKRDPKARDVYVKSLETFAERMVDVLELETPDVVLAEGAPAMSGDGFEKLFPSPENVAIGGTNVVTVDRVAAAYLGFWDSDALAKELGGHRTSPLLEVAAKRFGVDIKDPKLAGDGAALLAKRRPAHLIGMADFEIDETDAATAPAADAAALPKELHAKQISASPQIDGAIDDAWSAAAPIAFSTDWAGHASPIQTRVRALWSPKGLYMLWELDGLSSFTDTARPVDQERIDLYEENCVELFLVPDPANRERYFEIELGPYGHFFDILVDRRKKPRADNNWSANMRIATHRDDAKHTAIIEVAIESPDVAAVLAQHAALPLGLYRMEGKSGRQYLAAFPTRTPKPNFHVPEAFGTLMLDP